MKVAGDRNHWQIFWENNMLSPRMTAAIARGYWARLLKVVPVGKDWVGLDFGCGQGYLLRLMASSMKRVFGVDASPNMVAISRVTARDCRNVNIARAVEPPSLVHQPLLDLIVVNSCLQYLNNRELKDWLGWWIGSLSPRGRLVLSDLYPRQSSRGRNFRKTLTWGWREGCLGAVLHEFWLLLRHGYFGGVHYERRPEELLAFVDECGGEGSLLFRNLDFLSTRDTIIVRRRD